MAEGGDNFVISKKTVYMGVAFYLLASVAVVACLPWAERAACRWGGGVSAELFDPVSHPMEHLLAGNARFSCDMLRDARRELLRPLANVMVNSGLILKAQASHPLRNNPLMRLQQIVDNMEAAANATRRDN
jgi:hypothetical protein